MKEITLAGKRGIGFSAIVSDEDFAFVSQWTWSRHPKGYAIRTDRSESKRTIYMHKEIAVRAGICSSGLQADHRNGMKLDNRRENLRQATNQLNQANVGVQKNNRSGFKSVSKKKGKKNRPWIARIGVNRKRLHLGYFDTPEQAHEAYHRAAIQYFGEFARS